MGKIEKMGSNGGISMNIWKKVLIKILIIFICLSVFSFFQLSSEVSAKTLQEMTSEANGFIEKGKGEASGVEIDDALEDIKNIGKILTTVGTGVLVGAAAYMGIRYITATPETQGKLKQQLIGLVVAAFVIFGSYTIWNIVVSVVGLFDT